MLLDYMIGGVSGVSLFSFRTCQNIETGSGDFRFLKASIPWELAAVQCPCTALVKIANMPKKHTLSCGGTPYEPAGPLK